MGSAQVQGKLWGQAAADLSRLTEPATTPVYEAVFDAIGVGPGIRLLDAGCGAGLAPQLAHKRGERKSPEAGSVLGGLEERGAAHRDPAMPAGPPGRRPMYPSRRTLA